MPTGADASPETRRHVARREAVPDGALHDALLDDVVARARPHVATTSSDAADEFERFVRHYYARVPTADLQERTPEYLAAAAASHWELGAQRAPGHALVRVHTPSRATEGWDAPHTIVEIVNDDMSFLVDSVTMELVRLGLGIHLAVNARHVGRQRLAQAFAYIEAQRLE